jgi:hypothetical protein
MAALPLASAAQTTEGGRVYLMSRLLNFTKGQAVGIHFTNVARGAEIAEINFVDANGNILKTASGRVAPGQSVGLNFTFGELPRGSSGRVGIRGVIVVVQPTEPDTTPPEPDLSLANMEVYDTQTGRTSFGLLLPAVKNLNVYFPTDQ